MEALEDRTLLTATWACPSGDLNWATPSCWRGATGSGGLPGPNDDVDIPAGSGGSVTYSTGASVVRGITANKRLAILGGTLAFGGADITSVFNSVLTISGSSLTASGNVNITNSLILDGVSNTQLVLHGTLTTTTGRINWRFGTIRGRGTFSLGPAAQMSVEGAGEKYLWEATLNNSGFITWTGTGAINLLDAAVFNNQRSGRIEARSNAHLRYDDTGGPRPSTFINAGEFRKVAPGTGDTRLDGITFLSSGPVLVQSGRLLLEESRYPTNTIASGEFQLAAGTELVFGGGTHALNPGSAVQGQGLVRFRSGTVTLRSNYGVNNTTVDGGTANFATDVNLRNLNFSRGTLTGNGQITIQGPGHQWTGGTISGTRLLLINPGASLTISGGDDKVLDGRLFRNEGNIVWQGTGPIRAGNGSNLQNQGMFAVRDSTRFLYNGGNVPQFMNLSAGLVQKVVAGSTTNFSDVQFTNSGTVRVTSGTLTLAVSGRTNGGFEVAAEAILNLQASGPGDAELDGPFSVGQDAVLDFRSGSFVLGAGVTGQPRSLARFSGGTTRLRTTNYSVARTVVSGGVAHFASTDLLTVNNLELNAGRFLTDGQLILAGQSLWIDGTIGRSLGGTSIIFIRPGDTLALRTTGTKLLDKRRLQNRGIIDWTGGDLQLGNQAALDNQMGGVFQVSDNAGLYWVGGGASSFTNAGTVIKDSNGITTINVPFTNNDTEANPGTVEIKRGTLDISSVFTNFQNDTLTNGSYLVGRNLPGASSTLRFLGADIRTNAADIQLDGPNSQIVDLASGRNALDNFTTNAAGAGFTLRNGAARATAGAFTNAGSVQVEDGSALQVGGDYVQSDTGAQIRVRSSTLVVDCTFANSGSVQGEDDAQIFSGCDFVNDGTLAIAAGVTVVVAGNFTQLATGVLQIAIGQDPFGQPRFGQLVVSLLASLGGLFSMLLVDEARPTETDEFPLVTFGSRGGTEFDEILPPPDWQLINRDPYRDNEVRVGLRPIP